MLLLLIILILLFGFGGYWGGNRWNPDNRGGLLRAELLYSHI